VHLIKRCLDAKFIKTAEFDERWCKIELQKQEIEINNSLSANSIPSTSFSSKHILKLLILANYLILIISLNQKSLMIIMNKMIINFYNKKNIRVMKIF
jgi:hypothetical protein